MLVYSTGMVRNELICGYANGHPRTLSNTGRKEAFMVSLATAENKENTQTEGCSRHSPCCISTEHVHTSSLHNVKIGFVHGLRVHRTVFGLFV